MCATGPPSTTQHPPQASAHASVLTFPDLGGCSSQLPPTSLSAADTPSGLMALELVMGSRITSGLFSLAHKSISSLQNIASYNVLHMVDTWQAGVMLTKEG